MWSELLDDQGRVRGSIFYKAAFYDRRAFMHLNRLFTYSARPITGWDDENYRESPFRVCVTKGNEDVWHSEEYGYLDGDAERLNVLAAKTWLDEHYPEWDNVLAYWDE